MNLQEALDTALEISGPRLHDSLDATEFEALGVILAAARSVVEGTDTPLDKAIEATETFNTLTTEA